jgi:uncharacterized protein YeaO (DUF488 family)
MIKTKCVHSPINRSEDGLRVLVSRVRGRGLRASRYHVWMPNLAPSEALLRNFWDARITWAEFRHRYRKELREGGGVDRRNRTIKNHGQKFTLRLLQALSRSQTITVMCHCEDDKNCHRSLLKKLLTSKIT